jgi:hypothetical protein
MPIEVKIYECEVKKLYGLQLAMVNARFTTFQDTDHKEMVRKAPGIAGIARHRRNRKQEQPPFSPQRAQRPQRRKGDWRSP